MNAGVTIIENSITKPRDNNRFLFENCAPMDEQKKK